MQNEYLIPQEIKSETYFGRGVFLFDIAFVMLAYLIMSLFEEAVDQRFRIFYTILNVVVAFLLTRKSSINPQKRIYESILFSFMQKNEYYYFGELNYEGEVNYDEPYEVKETVQRAAEAIREANKER